MPTSLTFVCTSSYISVDLSETIPAIVEVEARQHTLVFVLSLEVLQVRESFVF